jgi:hypothetical protein
MKKIILLISLCLFSSMSWSKCIQGDCVNGQGTYTWPSGSKYVGQFKDNKFDGQGSYTWPDGLKYVGQWKDGNFDGQGTYTSPSGEKYVGQFKDDIRNGQGTYTWPSGKKYAGQYKDGKQNGQGTFTWPDGQKYVGQFKKDMRDGKGSHTRTDGSKYVGQFKDNSPVHGRGIDYLYDGRQMIHYGARTELRNANGELISSDLSVDDIAAVRSESANKKHRADERLARQKQEKERQLAEKRQQDRNKIVNIQQQLIDHLYLTGSVDGVVGNATRNALREFYKNADLRLPAFDALNVIAEDLNSNHIRSAGGCSLTHKEMLTYAFTVCFTIDR